MKIICRKTYHWAGHTLEFVPRQHTGGNTHRVFIDAQPVGWLAEGTSPSIKAARAYLRNKFHGEPVATA